VRRYQIAHGARWAIHTCHTFHHAARDRASAAARSGSPPAHAADPRGDVLVVHGTGDDDVHSQGAERTANAPVAADRPFAMTA
jgi:dipeptidyl aminopeptidase/acylaminoacyl peptidase